MPIAAVGSARGPGIKNPGAAFTAHIKRARAAAEARRASGTPRDVAGRAAVAGMAICAAAIR